MSYKLPKQQYKRETFITLNEGFHRVGMFLFSQEWIGHEDDAWPTTNHETLSDEKQKLEAKLHRCIQQERMIESANLSDMDEIEFKDHSDRLEAFKCLTREAREKRDQFGQTYDSRYSNALAYDRRQQVEKYLCDAIRIGELNLHFGHGTWKDMKSDFNLANFQISFLFSFVIMPKKYGRSRRHPGFFNKNHFDIWAHPFEQKLLKYCDSPIEEQIITWFVAYRDKCLSGNIKVTKEEALVECEKYFSQKELGAIFSAVWKLFSTKEMKKMGRPKSKHIG